MTAKCIAQDIDSCERTKDVFTEENVTFEDLSLSEKTLRGLRKCGFRRPSPVQLRAIPLGRCGFDLIVEAKSGTGKTAVFGIISLEMLSESGGLQVLILAPTREIASQIGQVLRGIGSDYDLNVETVMGGTSVAQDIERLKTKKYQILVGSPGRVLHLIKKRAVSMQSVRLFVLDEADKLMEDTFQKDINFIFSHLPSQKQIVAASATYTPELRDFLQRYMNAPSHIRPDISNILLGVTQHTTIVASHDNADKQNKIKFERLLKILSQYPFKQCLVFCKYQIRAQSLCDSLRNGNWPVEFLAGSQTQHERLDSLHKLQSFSCRILVATDLVSRGIDASNVDLIVNIDPPDDYATYLHRIGRAGRYGAKGMAITILSTKEEPAFKNMLSLIGSSDIPTEITSISNGDIKTNDKNLPIIAQKESVPNNEIDYLLSLMESKKSFIFESFDKISESLDTFTCDNVNVQETTDEFKKKISLTDFISDSYPKSTQSHAEQELVAKLENIEFSDSDSSVSTEPVVIKKRHHKIATNRNKCNSRNNQHNVNNLKAKNENVKCTGSKVNYDMWRRNLALACAQIEYQVYMETLLSFSGYN